MIENIPFYIPLVFIATTVLTLLFFFKATNYSYKVLALLLVWLALQAVLGFSLFYTVTDTIPPRFPLMVVPAVILILGLFFSRQGRAFIDKLDAKTLTYLHLVRIPVELVLFWLFLYGQVPELMTFEGRNFDILSGITAPIVAYFGYNAQPKFSKTIVLIWNFLCLGLLFNIVINAILSAPSPFQQFALEQPNVGVPYFPFVWLPSCIVPLVLLSHLVCIRQRMKN